jgi:RNA polymerase sigma factor (sigma-70 family)
MSDDGQQLETTASLLALVREGDAAARERLCRRLLPLLQAWARGRLPATARGMEDTDDLVQVTLLRALDKVKTFESRHPGAFLAYVRTILTNRIRDGIRAARRRPQETLSETLPAEGSSPLQAAIGAEAFEAYEQAMSQLTDQQRAAVMLRLGCSSCVPWHDWRS